MIHTCIQFETTVSVSKDENGYHAYLTCTLGKQKWDYCAHGSTASESIQNARIRAANSALMQEAIDKILVPVEYTIKVSVDRLKELFDRRTTRNNYFVEHYRKRFNG